MIAGLRLNATVRKSAVLYYHRLSRLTQRFSGMGKFLAFRGAEGDPQAAITSDSLRILPSGCVIAREERVRIESGR
jgi:hypothetical protein